MLLDAASPRHLGPETRAADGARQSGDTLASVIRFFDAILRRRMRIVEFCADRQCIFRLAVVRASEELSLRDGTRVAPGDTVGELHFWNEHLPEIPRDGPGLCWGIAMRRQLRHSLCRLASEVRSNPAYRDIRALQAAIGFTGGLGRARQVARLAAQLGFEVRESRRRGPAWLHDIPQSLFVWGLIRAFNPGALRRSPLIRYRHELWISRAHLLGRYCTRQERR